MPELAFDRRKWQMLADSKLDDFLRVGAINQHRALQHLAIQLLSLTEPALLESVWKSGAARINSPGSGNSGIDWKSFTEELARRIE